MSNKKNYITRMASKVSVITSQVFHCRGLQSTPVTVDRFGNHDLAYWIIFLATLAGWFLFLFAPQRERLKILEDRAGVLISHLKAEQKELLRLQQGIDALQRNNPRAWERAARGQLGWVEPGEMLDMNAWNQTRSQAPPNSIMPSSAITPLDSRIASTISLRPTIPAIPIAPLSLQTAGLSDTKNARPLISTTQPTRHLKK